MKKKKKKCKEKKKLKQHACSMRSAARLQLPTSMYRAGSKAGCSKFIGPISYGGPFNSFRRMLLILQRARHIVAASDLSNIYAMENI